MESDEPIIMITPEPSPNQRNSLDWISNFINHPVKQILLSPSSNEEFSFQSLVLKYAKTLKQTIISAMPSNTSSFDFCEVLNKYSQNLPEIKLDFENVKEKVNPFPWQESEPVIQKAFPIIEQITVNQETAALECRLYRNVLGVFNAENKTEAELHSFMDVSRSGKITALEFRVGLKRYGLEISDEETKEVFSILDGDKDGFVTVEDLKKRKKLIEQKAFDEVEDPFSCVVVSEPLSVNKIHGCLSLNLYRVNGLKGGPRCLKVSVKGNIEYRSSDFYDNNFLAGFKYFYLFENQDQNTFPDSIDFTIFNKSISEGFCHFNWLKSNSLSTEFSYRTKIDLRTSLGQSKGAVSFEVHWTPTIPPFLSSTEMEKLQILKEKVEKYQKFIHRKKFHFRSNARKFTDGFPSGLETEKDLDEKFEVEDFDKDQVFLINIHSTSYEYPKVKTKKVEVSSMHSINKSFSGLKKKMVRSPGHGSNKSFCGLDVIGKETANRPKTPQFKERNSLGSPNHLKVSLDEGRLNNSFN